MPRKKGPLNAICEVCGTHFHKTPYGLKSKRHFCTRKCYFHWRRNHPVKEPNMICDHCGKAFYRPESQICQNKRIFCSRKCVDRWRSEFQKGRQPKWFVGLKRTEEGYQRWKKAMSGPNNPAWKGGVTYRKRKGRYPSSVKYVRCPPEFKSMARKDGYVMEHRLIMAQHLGRPLKRSEVVHHLNHDPADNRLENLRLFGSNGEHKEYEGKTGYFKEYYQDEQAK
jgi:hypothetical protein